MPQAKPIPIGDDDFKARDVRLRLETLSRVLDSAFLIPGTRIPVGLDAMLSVVPVAGSTVSSAVSAYLTYEAARLGVPRRDLLRMAGNVGVDFVLSSIPVLGIACDVFFRANNRNMGILRDHINVVDKVVDHEPTGYARA